MQAGTLTYWLTHPDAIIFTVASGLLYPVLIIEVLALLYVVFETGRFAYEVAWQYRRRDIAGMEKAAKLAHDDLATGHTAVALARLVKVRGGLYFRRFFAELDASGDTSRTRVLKRLNDMELQASKRLERTRVFIRIGPILGLMGTLIPISPALVALARGNVEALSTNLVVAFSTTVIGLLIGGLAYLVSTVRDRRYTQDISDIEYVLETMGS